MIKFGLLLQKCYDIYVGNELKKEEKLTMNQATPAGTEHSHITNHRFFARIYERLSRGPTENSFMDPLRRETAGQGRGVVFGGGPGHGLNFSFFCPGPVGRGETCRTDTGIVRFAQASPGARPRPHQPEPGA